jgi:minor extracellular serine protease Vpr
MRKLIGSLLALGLATSAIIPAQAADPKPFADAGDLAVPSAMRQTTAYTARADKEVTVLIRLAGEPLASFVGNSYKQARRAGQTSITREAQIAHVRALRTAQDAVMSQAAGLGARELNRMQRAVNGVAVRVKASQLAKLRALPGVVSVRPINNYEQDLSETVPYIGAKAVQDTGVTGSGVTVAVLDSGIDYTHKNLGGVGTLAAYAAAYGTAPSDPKNTTRDGLFPTDKVVAGYDFVGESWPNAAEVFDPDPIDLEGHGTHVADIIAGASVDGTHKGVAPGASLVAIKVCSAISSSCSGLALLAGVDFALDPNMDGDMSDAVDVMNLSLGSSYGQEQDDLSYALGAAVGSGVVVVASAGNSADRPYIAGSPSTQPEVISVAQTAVPSAKTFPLVITINGAQTIISNTNSVDWAPIGAGFSGAVMSVATAADPNGLACVAAGVPDLTGKVALIQRGTCAISLKVDAAAKKGAIGVLVYNNAAGDPPTFSFGGGDTFVPTVILTQADGRAIAGALLAGRTVNASVSPAVSISLAGSVVASSSRGPSYSYSAIKPEIGAPGASVSAVAGSGDGTDAFGGTSGAAPMVSGAAALLLAARSNLAPRDVKALLVNTADDNIQINPATQPGVLAPITRIGGGEVRVDKAVAAKTAVWAQDDQNPTLSFGYRAITQDRIFGKNVVVRNFSNFARTYTITPKFRYADDAASGAVTPLAPATITVPANSRRTFRIELKVNASKLPTWTLNGGSRGGDGFRLQSVEFDGYVDISDASETVHVPWHILPRKSVDMRVSTRQARLKDGVATVTVSNSGAEAATVEAFALTGISPRMADPIQGGPGYNYFWPDLQAVGVRPVQVSPTDFGVQFALTTNDVRAHPNYPAGFEIYIDNDRDGDYEYVLFNFELTGFAATGQCVVGVADLTTGLAYAAFFCDADLNSGNIIFTAALADIGLTSIDQEFSFEVQVFDNYFTGNFSDGAPYMTTRANSPRYFGYFESGVPIPAGGSAVLTIEESTNGWTEPTQSNGVLLLYRNAGPGKESEIIRVR